MVADYWPDLLPASADACDLVRHRRRRRGPVRRMPVGLKSATMIGPLSYIGGKRRIAKQLVALIPVTPHTSNRLPAALRCSFTNHAPRWRSSTTWTKRSSIFSKCVQRHPQELSRILRWQPASRRLFAWHRMQSPDVLTDIERAARFFYLQKNTWSGKRTRQNFHFAVAKPPSYTPATLAKRLRRVATRLDNVQLEASPYQSISLAVRQADHLLLL